MGDHPDAAGDRLGSELSEAVVLFHEALGGTLGLSATDHKALDLLAREGPMSAGDLAHRIGLSKAAVTGLVDRLEAAGVARRQQDAGDRRKLVVDAVPFTNPRFRQSLDRLRESMADLATRYSDAELAVIGDWVNRTTQILREQTKIIIDTDTDQP